MRSCSLYQSFYCLFYHRDEGEVGAEGKGREDAPGSRADGGPQVERKRCWSGKEKKIRKKIEILFALWCVASAVVKTAVQRAVLGVAKRVVRGVVTREL